MVVLTSSKNYCRANTLLDDADVLSNESLAEKE